MKKFFVGVLGLYTLTSFIPLSKSDHWAIRVVDFPRLQLWILGLIAFAVFLYLTRAKRTKTHLILILPVIALVMDGYRIIPYTPLFPTEVTIQKERKGEAFTVYTVNVLQTNTNYKLLIGQIKEIKPDVILLLEVDQKWMDEIKEITKDYPTIISKPLNNTYGLAFYSKLKVRNGKINFLFDDDVPSIQATIESPEGKAVEFFGIHPKPPRPDTDKTTKRDAELILVAKAVSKFKGPVLVMGDLNDVAWSHTSRLFRRLSNLMDPRIGRGPYPTFPAHLPFMRFPLDYIYHSQNLELTDIKRMDDIGSDHFPMYASFQYEQVPESEKKPSEVETEDVIEAKETLKKAK